MATIATESQVSDGAVDLGSDIKLNNGAILSIQGGTVNIITGGLQILIGPACGIAFEGTTKHVEFSADLPLAAPVFRLQGPALVGPNGSWMEFRKGDSFLHAGIENRGGRMTLMKGIHVILLRAIPDSSTAYDQQGGILELTNGSILDIPGNKDISIDGGTVRTIGAIGSNTNNVDIYVREFAFFSGDIFINDDTMAHQYGTLTIHGRMEWDGGTYRPRVDAAFESGYCDKLVVTGEMLDISGVVTAMPLDGEDNEVAPGFSSNWIILTGGRLRALNEVECSNGDSWVVSPFLPPPLITTSMILGYSLTEN